MKRCGWIPTTPLPMQIWGGLFSDPGNLGTAFPNLKQRCISTRSSKLLPTVCTRRTRDQARKGSGAKRTRYDVANSCAHGAASEKGSPYVHDPDFKRELAASTVQRFKSLTSDSIY